MGTANARGASSTNAQGANSTNAQGANSTNAQGALGEALAERHLVDRGLRIVARNYRCRGGEIDLVADDRGTLVFVEVRMRRNARFGGAAASIDARKQARIVLAARHYLLGKRERPCRFDVVLLSGASPSSLEWIRDAFAT
jgi:putative endonuclease